VKYQETIFELLAKQFEAAKIDEAKEAGIIQIVDPAIAPDRKSRPKRALIVIATTLLAAMVAVFWAFVREARARISRDPAGAARLAALHRHIALR
jgi:uncharacterized protein involved in exopolysaccharide biosynthesis